MTTGLIYVRYSPKPMDAIDRDEASSLDYQEDVVRRYFDFIGVTTAEVIKDAETSARLVQLRNRKDGKRLLELTSGKPRIYSIVGVMRLDRLFRNVVDGITTCRFGGAAQRQSQ